VIAEVSSSNAITGDLRKGKRRGRLAIEQIAALAISMQAV
jgi:hypothetical protein